MSVIYLIPQRTVYMAAFLVPFSLGVLIGILLYFLTVPFLCWAQDFSEDEGIVYLKKLSIEDLLETEVTSVSKRTEKVAHAAAAVFVITNDDIRRSGVTTIPEALRMVPGLQVTRIDASKWAITSRGFNGRFANKLLVLIDGRSVYTPLYSGVFWDIQDMLMEDIDRIEVVRGPGATLWGANAVNGVINIITKHAKYTQGGLVSLGVGTEERGFGSIRYGASLGNDAYCRVYTKYFNRDNSVDTSGAEMADEWDALRGGFRIDWQKSDHSAMTLQGDIYNGDAGQTITLASLNPPYTNTVNENIETKGGNILLRWNRNFSEYSDIVLQMYYDRNEHNEIVTHIIQDTFDIDFQRRLRVGKSHELIWGLGYRFLHDDINDSFNASFNPDSRGDNLFSAFLQDDLTLIKDRLRFTVGSKFEHNDYTGFEVQPNGRLLWTLSDDHIFWAAISRAVRTPSRGEHDGRINSQVIPPLTPENPTPFPVVVSIITTRNFDSEKLLAYELGYRIRPVHQLSFDLSLFYNDYNGFRSTEYGTSYFEPQPPPGHFVTPIFLNNKIFGETYGVEMVSELQMFPWCRIRASYAFLQIQMHTSDPANSFLRSMEDDFPHNQVSLQTSMNVLKNLECDVWFRYVDSLPGQDVGSYVTLDVRLGWNPCEHLEMSLMSQNLLDRRRLEFMPEILDISPTEIERSIYGKIIWHF